MEIEIIWGTIVRHFCSDKNQLVQHRIYFIWVEVSIGLCS